MIWIFFIMEFLFSSTIMPNIGTCLAEIQIVQINLEVFYEKVRDRQHECHQ